MKIFLSSLLLLLAIADAVFSNECPKSCMCSSHDTILCPHRISPIFPKDVSPDTRNIYLFGNEIEVIFNEDFDQLDHLEMLDLSQNKLTQISDRVFEPLTSLRNLDLSSNQITHISEESFHGMVRLERLYLYSNQIETIHPAAFDGLENLLELKLQNNLLTSPPILSMPRLLLLDLSFNVIPTLSSTNLQTPNLESLKLESVSLTTIGDTLLGGLKNLHDLDISDNQIKSYPSGLNEISGLFHLNISGNPMSLPTVEELRNLQDLNELDISSLGLKGLPEEFPQLFPHLKKLRVSQNPFNCICNMAWFPQWLVAQEIKLEKSAETRCHFPLNNAGKLLETMIHSDFGCPSTTTITTTTVTSTTTIPPVLATTVRTTTKANRGNEIPPPIVIEPTSDRHEEQSFCPPETCLHGGTCHLDQLGQVRCDCPQGTSGTFCEIQNLPSPPKPVSARPTITSDAPDISSSQATGTSISLNLHRYIEMRPYLRGIRLTYRNLSGQDQRPRQLSLPSSYPEYNLRGLNPNCTYSICASPLGALDDTDVVCTEARTAPEHSPPEKVEQKLTSVLVPATAILLVVVLIAVTIGVVCYIRRRRGKGLKELDCEPSQLELDGVKGGLDSGTLPSKQPQHMNPELAVENGSLEYVLLLQDQCSSNNYIPSNRPIYF